MTRSPYRKRQAKPLFGGRQQREHVLEAARPVDARQDVAVRRGQREPLERHRRGMLQLEAAVEPLHRVLNGLEPRHRTDPLQDHLEREQDVALEDLLEEPPLAEARRAPFPLEDRLDDVLDDVAGGVGKGLLPDQAAVDQGLREILGFADVATGLRQRAGGDLAFVDQTAPQLFVFGAGFGEQDHASVEIIRFSIFPRLTFKTPERSPT
jgi:hypothetical protein